MSNVKVAKLFRNGGSQAVRLPAEFRFEGDEVYARRDERTGDVILSTVEEPRKTGKAFWDEILVPRDAETTEDEDFDAYMTERPMNTPVQDRDIFGDDTRDVPREERDEFGKIMDEIVGDRQNHPVSFTSRLVDDEDDA